MNWSGYLIWFDSDLIILFWFKVVPQCKSIYLCTIKLNLDHAISTRPSMKLNQMIDAYITKPLKMINKQFFKKFNVKLLCRTSFLISAWNKKKPVRFGQVEKFSRRIWEELDNTNNNCAQALKVSSKENFIRRDLPRIHGIFPWSSF